MINQINNRQILALNVIVSTNLLNERSANIILNINGADCNYWYVQPNLLFIGTF
jgi:hypothetical protein